MCSMWRRIIRFSLWCIYMRSLQIVLYVRISFIRKKIRFISIFSFNLKVVLKNKNANSTSASMATAMSTSNSANRVRHVDTRCA